MANETERSKPASTLPQAELNPLLNPVLGQNMGRWAEVYFTAPPERREQAVSELLEELKAAPEGQATTNLQNDSPQSPNSQAHSMQPAAPVALPADASSDLVCQACGFHNPGDQRFCGMCGARLASGNPNTPSQSRASEDPIPAQGNANQWAEQSHDDFPWREKFASARENAESRGLPFRGFYPATESSPYRGYVVTAVIATVLALGYLGWRSQHRPPTSENTPQIAPFVSRSEQATPSSASAQPISEVPPARPPADTTHSPGPATTPAPQEPRTVAKASPQEHTATPPAPAPVAASSSVSDVVMAQNYLNGSNGYQRNSAEAAGWLWKAVSKQNAYAALLLSDLYLRGDGVAKNCDQARILLDAAASKGIAQAGVRLRNMQAFGCQ